VSSGSDAAGQALGKAGLLTQLRFSREQEARADEVALAALADLYGHVRDADRAFEALASRTGQAGDELPTFALTHPHIEDRIETLRALSRTRGYRTSGELTALEGSPSDPR
jgi:Zn-dependent protease with chaperone function